MYDRKFLQGTLDVLVLKTLSWGPMHGYGVASWLEERTAAALKIEEGSLYPALHRMERKGWIESEWRLTENDRRAKFYRLTAEGRHQLEADASGWAAFADAVGKVLYGTEAPAWAS
ncbi:MAG TPA: PadR family transcriptional regulator [Longimicrobium sp.]|nr:PadR family transcriptional regulator [Longimicrobium sp.]